MSYTIQYDSNQYVLYHEDCVACTPAGNEIKTRFPALLREAIEDLRVYGPDPTAAISVYNLICSYTDCGRRTSKSGLIDAVFSDLKIDIIFDLPADPEACRFLRACYDNDLFDRLGIRPSLTPPDLKRLEAGSSCRRLIFRSDAVWWSKTPGETNSSCWIRPRGCWLPMPRATSLATLIQTASQGV